MKILFLMAQFNFSITYSLTFLLVLLSLQKPIKTSVPGLFIDRISLSNNGATATNLYYDNSTMAGWGGITTAVKNFTYNWRETVPSILASGLSMHNFVMSIAASVSYVVELQNMTIYSTDIYLATYLEPPWVYYLTFNVILLTQNSTRIQFLQQEVLLTSYIAKNPFIDINITSQFSNLFEVGVQMFPFIQWIKYNSLTKIYGISVYLTINSPNKIGLQIDHLHYTDGSCMYLYFHSLKVSILIINCTAYQPSLAFYKVYSSYIPPIFQNYVEDHSCIFSLNKIIRYVPRQAYLYFNLSSAMNSVNSSNNYYSGIFVFCVTSCPLRYYINYDSLTYQCISCSRNCLTCTESYICTKCSDQSLLANSSCHVCSSLMLYCYSCNDTNFCTKCLVGFRVGGLCTSITGCTLLVAYRNGTTPGTQCKKCNQTSFYYNLMDQKCYCKVGRLVGLYCIDMPGCITTLMINNSVVCTRCSPSGYFVYINYTCVCKDGFQLKNKTCNDICGDGRVFLSQCDDGNLIDGDGCSSQCKVQILYKCLKSEIISSNCTYFGLNINITLSKIRSGENTNQGIFSFEFNPKLEPLTKMDLMNYFFFHCDNANFSVDKWVYSGGKAQVYVNYTTTLQGKQGYVNFTFDYSYVHHLPIMVDFKIQSKNMKLFYYKSQFNSNISYVLMALSSMGIFLVVCCSWLHKMIGIQYLFTCQIIYYSQFCFKYYDSVLSALQYLSPSTYNYKSKSFSLVNFILSPQIIELQFSRLFADQTTLGMCCLVTIPIILNLVLHSCEQKLQNIKFLKQISNKNILLTQIVTPILLSYGLPAHLMYFSHTRYENTNKDALFTQSIRAVLFFYLIGLYYLDFHVYFKRIFFKFPQRIQINYIVANSKKQYYLVFRLLLLVSFGLSYLWLIFNQNMSFFIFFGVIVAMLLWQIFYRPYVNLIDNINIILNITLIISSFVLIFLQNNHILQQSQANSLIIIYFFVIGLSLCCFISIIRLFLVIRDRIKKYKNEDRKDIVNVEAKNKSQSDIKQRMIYEEFIEKKKILPKVISWKNLETDQLEITSNNQKNQQENQRFLSVVKSYRQKFRKKKLNNTLIQKQ